jgi:regulator of protease activity HflC (stomatin/prohibitin superfamily)
MELNLDWGNIGTAIIVLLLVGFLVLLAVTNIRIVPQAHANVVERLGAYKTTWQVGLHFKIPLIDRIAHRISLKEHVTDFPPQPVITKDNVTIEIDTVIYFQVTDAKLYAYGVENPMAAIENLTATTLRNIIGELELDQTLTSREHINTKIRLVLDEATDAWGIKINRVEVKNINPPKDIQLAMEKQMRAERERREVILRAEGEKRSAILVAEGQKEAMILEAEGRKQAAVKKAEGDAEAIMLVQKATAEGIKLIVASAPSREVLTIKGLEAFEKAANGKATKIIIPSEIQGLAGLASSLTAISKDSAEDEADPSIVRGPENVAKVTTK